MYRNSSYDNDLAKKLKNSEFARGFIRTLMEGEEGLSLDEALRTTIQSMGVKEFCELSGLRMQNVNEFLKGRRKLKAETYDAFLKPFALRVRFELEDAS